MNLDGDSKTSLLEIQAYLTRNIYVVCRPVRGRVSADLREEENANLGNLYQMLDKKGVFDEICRAVYEFDRSEWLRKSKPI